MHIFVIYSRLSQKVSRKPMYLHSTLNFLSLDTYDTPGGDGIIFITYEGTIRLPSPIVRLAIIFALRHG